MCQEKAFPRMNLLTRNGETEVRTLRDWHPPRLGGDFNSCRKEHGLGFAVHWPPSGVASPRFHGVPRRDVP